VRLRSRPWREGFLAAFATATLCVLSSTSVRADAPLASVAADAIHRAITVLREREITTLTLILALLGFVLLAIVVLMRIRRAADRAGAGSELRRPFIASTSLSSSSS
jgi:hypothetical protein